MIEFKINLRKLVLFQITILMVSVILIGLTNLTQIIYITDIVNIIIFIDLIINHRLLILDKKLNLLLLIFIIEILYWSISFGLGSYSTFSDYVKMARIFIRPLIIFVASSVALTSIDYKLIYKRLNTLFYIHFLMVLFQIFVQGYSNGDEIGGIFGVRFGYGNIASHFLLVFILIFSMSNYISKDEKILQLLTKLIMMFSIALLTEMKSFVFEAFIIVFFLLITQKKINMKILICIIFLSIASIIFVDKMNQYFHIDLFSFDQIEGYLSRGYAANDKGIGRIDGFTKINDTFFHNDITKVLFGMGFSSSISSYILRNYKDMNINYFTYAKVFFDCGIVGLLLYYMPFMWSIVCSIRNRKNDKLSSNMIIIFSMICLYFTFYGNLLESDFCGYLTFIVLSIPFIRKKETNCYDKC